MSTDKLERQWAKLKEQHPYCIILMRNDEFYMMFDDDAKKASEVLGIVLYSDNTALFPHHALDTYLPRLIRAGLRVCIANEIK